MPAAMNIDSPDDSSSVGVRQRTTLLVMSFLSRRANKSAGYGAIRAPRVGFTFAVGAVLSIGQACTTPSSAGTNDESPSSISAVAAPVGTTPTTTIPPPTAESITTSNDASDCRTEGSTRGSGEQRKRCTDGEWVPDPYVPESSRSDTDDAASQAVSNVMILSGFERGSESTENLRLSLADYVDTLGFDRVDIVSGEVTSEGAYLILDVSTGYSTEDFQLEVLIDAISTLARDVWSNDLFGAATPEGTIAVGLKITSDGRLFVVSGADMVAVRDRRASASQVLNLA